MGNLACMSINKSPHDVVGVSREAKIVSSAGERGRKRQGGLRAISRKIGQE